MTIVHLPFAYEIKLIPPKRRNPERHVVRDMAPFDIPEITDADAPISIKWTQIKYAKMRGEDPVASRTLAMRTYRGKCFSRVELQGGEPLKLDEFKVDVAKDPLAWAPTSYGRIAGVERPRWSSWHYPTLPLFSDSPFASRRSVLSYFPREESIDRLKEPVGKVRIVSDDREARLIEAARILPTALLIVDGEIWTAEKTWEPWWSVQVRGGKVELGVGYGQKALYYIIPFRADRRDDALAYAKEVAAKSGQPLVITDDIIEINHGAKLIRDDIVMLAETLLSGQGIQISNREDFEPWSNRASEAANELRRLTRSGDQHDLTWAIDVFLAAEKFYQAMPKPLPETMRYAHEFLNGIQPAFERWQQERAARPDLVQLTEARLTELAEQEDEALSAFSPNAH